MRRQLASVALILALPGCGAPDQPQASEGAMADFQISSDAFDEGATVPTEYTCDGADRSPALSWTEPPAGTQSFALIMDDPDAPNGTFTHWAAYDIGRETRELPTGAGGGGGAADFSQGRNDFGNSGYGGPCPPPGHGPHRYRFKLYALDVRQLTELGGGTPSVTEVEQAAQQHQVAMTQLTGRYERR